MHANRLSVTYAARPSPPHMDWNIKLEHMAVIGLAETQHQMQIHHQPFLVCFDDWLWLELAWNHSQINHTMHISLSVTHSWWFTDLILSFKKNSFPSSIHLQSELLEI